ncbi:MAG: ABC transporter substrate-binding protein [bacterium]
MKRVTVICLVLILSLFVTSVWAASVRTGNDIVRVVRVGGKLYFEYNDGTRITEIEMAKLAKAEGKIVSYGMPDDWANLGEIWKAFCAKYGLTHEDTDMGSMEELNKFAAEKDKPIADVGDIGIAFGSVGIKMGVLAPFKNSRWNEIPDWAKEGNGYWCTEYFGTIAFLVRTDIVKNPPKSFKDLLKPEYKLQVCMDDPRQGAQGQYTLLAAAFANGGDEKNIMPGIEFFAKLKSIGNLKPVETNPGNIQRGEAPIAITWDFRALEYKRTLGVPLEVIIPRDGTAIGAYVAIINKYAPHPYTARLFNEFLFSNEAQIMYAKSGASPIRKVIIPKEIASQLPTRASYKNARAIKDWDTWTETSKKIPDLWEEEVLSK